MADEQTPQSDLIEDALRKAERQLEERLAAFQMTALGEPATRAPEDEDPATATLRPTSSERQLASLPAPEPATAAGEWRESASADVRFEPVLDDVFATQVPESTPSSHLDGDGIFAASSSINDLVATWDAEDETAQYASPTAETVSPSVATVEPSSQVLPPTMNDSIASTETYAADTAEPYIQSAPTRTTWSTPAESSYEPAPARRAAPQPMLPS
ncbi:MAG: hypothetical protein JWN41_1515, partial [Thermoleophilia bacterium]|nr:hypothetical protein [Thermoleophilia bacterium]